MGADQGRSDMGGSDAHIDGKVHNYLLGGGFKHLLFSPLPGEMIRFDMI